MEDRMEMRDDLLVSLGMLVEPVHRLLFAEPFAAITRYQKLVLLQRFKNDFNEWSEKSINFCRYKEIFWAQEHNDIIHTVSQIIGFTNNLDERLEPDIIAAYGRHYDDLMKKAKQLIRNFPVDVPDHSFPPNSPFQAYRLFRSLCAGAVGRVELFDPYVGATVFHRYLFEVPDDCEVRVVTDRSIMGSTERRRMAQRNQVVAVSELYAEERPDRYWYLVVDSIHDRHLRVDDKIFHLGGSMDAAARRDSYTLANLDPQPSIVSMLDEYIASADAWYCPGMAAKDHKRSV